MVKLALVARLRDGMPLSQTPAYLNENSEVVACYKLKGELVIKEISRGALPHPKMSILIDQHCFHYLVGDGICYTTLCESWYPRKLAFNYLEDLQKELQKVDSRIIESFSEPYACKRFGNSFTYGKQIMSLGISERTQENLYKLNSDPRNELKITTEEFANIMRNCESSGYEVGTSATITQTNSAVCCSNFLEVSMKSLLPHEVIALKWTPITIIVVVAATLLWANAVLNEYDT